MKNKIIITACAALLAFAIAPGAASAALYSGATKLPLGSEVRGVSGGVVQFQSGGQSIINCTSSEWGASLIKNNEGRANAKTEWWGFHGTGPEGLCTSPYGNVAVIGSPNSCWEAEASSWYLISGSTCGRGLTDFTVYFSGLKPCTYKIAPTYVYGSTQSPIELSGSGPLLERLEGNLLCSPTYRLQAGWKITDGAKNPLTFK
jgi:hypothetical protein